MKKTTFLTVFLLMIASVVSVYAQTLSSVVVDSASQKPIPYVTVLLNNKGMITNEEGRFTFVLDGSVKETDSLTISCMGYETIGKPLHEFTESVITMKAKAIELHDVIVTNKNYTAKEIIDLVKDNLEKNYNKALTKKRLFYRNSEHSNFSKTNYTFVKSTIEELNKPFLDSVLNSVPKKSSYYTEILCDLYGNLDEEKQKIKLIKASELYDKNNEISFTGLEERFNKIIKKNVKPNSYLKIKSGWFGTKVKGEDFDEFYNSEVDSSNADALKEELEKKKKNEIERKKNFAKYRKNTLGRLLQDLFFMDDSHLNFINKSRKYEFTIKNFTYLRDDAVYVLDFKPKGSADYKGTLYINADDFAVIRVDYENVKSLKKFNLLGLSSNEFLGRGKIIFSKGLNDKYNLRYLEQERGSRFGIRRPLKIIEKNKYVKGRNKQNELSLKLDMGFKGINKIEVIVFDTQPLAGTTYESLKEENSILPTYMPNYDPEFWKGHNIIAPNMAIQDFTSEVELED